MSQIFSKFCEIQILWRRNRQAGSVCLRRLVASYLILLKYNERKFMKKSWKFENFKQNIAQNRTTKKIENIERNLKNIQS